MAWQPSPEAMKTLTRLDATWATEQGSQRVRMRLFDRVTGDQIGKHFDAPAQTPESMVLDDFCKLHEDTPKRQTAAQVIDEQAGEISRLRKQLENLQGVPSSPPAPVVAVTEIVVPATPRRGRPPKIKPEVIEQNRSSDLDD